MPTARIVLAALVTVLVASGPAMAEGPGVLLLAHGGKEQWNAHVTSLVSQLDQTLPTEVAFGMAARASLRQAVDRLRARGVTEIVAVPLFVSSWSSVMTSTEFLLGQRKDAPPELAIYAKMNHAPPGRGGHGAADAADGSHANHGQTDPMAPIVADVPIRMTPALNDHPIVAEILADRARSVSRSADREAVILVAHGPVGDDDNRRWLADMASLATRIADTERFAAIEYLTLRDDAPAAVRDRATKELRTVVSGHLDAGRRVLIVPLLISFGGIEQGLRERLEGLTYAMPSSALMPDDRLVRWVLAMAKAR